MKGDNLNKQNGISVFGFFTQKRKANLYCVPTISQSISLMASPTCQSQNLCILHCKQFNEQLCFRFSIQLLWDREMFGSLRGRKNTLFGSGPFRDCELDEKNGIIITIISVIKFGFCPSLHVILTCDCTVPSFALCRSFYLNLPNAEFQPQCQGAFSHLDV